jgi:thiaminase
LFETTENPANTAYLRHLENVGTSGDFIDIMAVLSPTFLGYAEIGAKMASQKTSSNYQRWIKTYSNKSTQSLRRKIGSMIDDAVVHDLVRMPWLQIAGRGFVTVFVSAQNWKLIS